MLGIQFDLFITEPPFRISVIVLILKNQRAILFVWTRDKATYAPKVPELPEV